MNEQKNDNDEISLIDLFTVLIRYRKLIIGITLCSVVLAAAGYFIYPIYQYNRALRGRQTEGKALIAVRTIARPYVSQSLDSFFNRADVVLASFREAGMKDFEYARNQTISLVDETERSRALFLINQRLIKNENLSGKELTVKERIFQIITSSTKDVTTVVKDTYTIEAVFYNKDREMVESFLQALFVRGNAMLENYVRPFAETMVRNYEQFMNAPNISESMRLVLERDFQAYVFLRDFLAGKESILMEIGETAITQPEIYLEVYKSGYRIIGIVIVFAGIFCAVFFAFVLNAIRSIKNDKEAMEKIYDALGRPEEK